MPCAGYTPQQVKGAVCGRGRADKEQVARMVEALLALPEPPRPDHAADALAVADLPRQPRAAGGRAGRERAMIALLRGEVAVRRADHVVVLCDAVGYRAAVSAETLRHVPPVGEQVTLHTHLIVRDDALALYGFHSEQERDLFLMLLSVQAVGPKVALAVLSGGPPRELIAALAAGDAARFQAVPGIGKRTAERIIVELREKVAERRGRRAGRAGDPRAPAEPPPSPRALARDGLLELGYAPAEAEELLREADGQTRRGADRRGAAAGEERRVTVHRAARIQTPYLVAEDELDRSLRPQRARRVRRPGGAARAARGRDRGGSARGEALDHLLLAGPPGLGKTSLAQIVAAELDVPFVQTAGPALERKGDIAAFLTALEPRSVFFVDEIHRLPRTLEETFYPAMEDHRLPITVGQGAGARVVTLELPPFTLVGATTRAGLLTTPLRDRFGIQARLEPYSDGELAVIVRRSAGILEIELDERRRGRDRGAQPRHAARGQPAAQARARLRGGAHGGRRHGGRRRGRAGAARGRRARPGPARPRDPAARSARSSPAGRSASRRWRSPSARSRTRSRTCTSPTCCSRA